MYTFPQCSAVQRAEASIYLQLPVAASVCSQCVVLQFTDLSARRLSLCTNEQLAVKYTVNCCMYDCHLPCRVSDFNRFGFIF